MSKQDSSGANADRVEAALRRILPEADHRRLPAAAASIAAAAVPEGRASKRHGGGATRAVPWLIIEQDATTPPPDDMAAGRTLTGSNFSEWIAVRLNNWASEWPHDLPDLASRPMVARRPKPIGLPRGPHVERPALAWPVTRRAALVAYAEADPGIAAALGAPIGLWRALALEAARGGEWGLIDPPSTAALKAAAWRLSQGKRSRRTADPDSLWLAVVTLRVLDDLSGRRAAVYDKGGPQPAATCAAAVGILAALGLRLTASSRWPAEWIEARRLLDCAHEAPPGRSAIDFKAFDRNP